MTFTPLQRLRLVRVCARIQATLGIGTGLLGSFAAVFAAITDTDDPADWSGVVVLVGIYAAAIGFGTAMLLIALSRRLEHPAARRGLFGLEIMIAAACSARHPLLAPTPPSLLALGLLVPAVVSIGAVIAIEAAAGRR
jgi:hypothetical protein